MSWDEIDWEDESGSIAFREWEKRNDTRRKTKEDLEKVRDFTPDDWILMMLHANSNSLIKTPIFKQLFILGERTGLNDSGIFSWYPHDYGPHSVVIENTLDNLIFADKIDLQINETSDGHLYKNYVIKDSEHAKRLWNLLPDSIRDVLFELRDEFKDKSVKEMVDYVHNAYPEYATRAAVTERLFNFL